MVPEARTATHPLDPLSPEEMRAAAAATRSGHPELLDVPPLHAH